MRLGNTKRRRVTQPLGIWQPEYRKDYSAYENQAAVIDKNPYAGGKKKTRKRWGLLHVVFSFISLALVSLGYSILLSFQYSRLHPLEVQRLADLQLNAPQSEAAKAAYSAFVEHLTAFTQQPGNLLPGAVLQYSVWLLFMAFATYLRGNKSWRKDFWLRWRKIDLLFGFLIGLGLYLAFTLLGTLASLVHIDLSGSDNTQMLFQSSGFILYFITFGLGGIIGPFMEELYFRGFVMQGLIRYMRKGLRTEPNTLMGGTIQRHLPGLYRAYTGFKHWLYRHKYFLAILITAIVFGAVHVGEVHGLVNQITLGVLTGSIGLVLGYIAVKTRRLGMNMMTHMTFNTLGVLAVFLIPS